MTPNMVLLWTRPDGRTAIMRPALLPLIRMQMQRKDYEPAEDMQTVAEAGVPAEQAKEYVARRYDRDHELGKLKSNGSPEARVAAALAFFDAEEKGGLTLEEACRVIAMKDGAWEGGEITVCTEEDFLNACGGDVGLRHAVRAEKGKPVIDMALARDLHRHRLRSERVPELAALDVDYQRADEAGDGAAKARVAARKQALRDVPRAKAIEAADTPAALGKLTLEALTK